MSIGSIPHNLDIFETIREILPEGIQQNYFTKALAEVYRTPSKFSGAYKQGLYDLVSQNPEIHLAAIKINQSRRRRRRAR
ncbi:MAG TPA: hypothetical protein VN370_13420 [Desulfitobacteriaceae bacterium]|nr:hypothetical protein [Desulfitobacteriaceae bacterium]